jgi:hypothetical protein
MDTLARQNWKKTSKNATGMRNFIDLSLEVGTGGVYCLFKLEN